MIKLILIVIIPPFIYLIIIKLKFNFDKSSKLIDSYIKPSNLLTTLVGIVIVYMLAYLFYRSHKISAVISILGLIAPRVLNTHVAKKRKREYKIQFREALYNLSSALQVGISLENAFDESIYNLELVFGEKSMIVMEFEIIVNRLKLNHNLEECLLDFNDRVLLEELSVFTELIITCRKKGGNIVELIKGCNMLIAEKISIEEEIETMLSEKKLEQAILLSVPIFLIAILSMSSADFIDPLFTTLDGKIAVTISLILFVISYWASKRIMDIEV